ncbi:helix-turn-helix transcriptional regulator [Dongia sp.]|uniref:helix-turn-helix transcriptional regulator n=1 Tax=Dongia sp. TaxID=1977262 RepID=UPI0035B3A2EB
MHKNVINYLRTFRRQWGLTQDEVAFLLGWKSATPVSNYEKLKSTPRLYAIFAFQAIFGELPQKLFPSVFSSVEEEVLTRAYQLLQKLESEKSPEAVRKCALLRDMLRRGMKKTDNHNEP